MDSSYRLPSRPVVDPVANKAAVVQGDRFRITVLTDGLLRLEYADDGRFEDRASAFALFRDLPVPDYRVIEGRHHLEIVTERVHLVYDRGPFSPSGLSIQVRGNISSYHSLWRFGDAVEDLGGTARTLDDADGAVPLESGVVSWWGYALLDDSRTLVLDDDGWVAPRDGTRTDLYFFGYGHDYQDAVRAFYAVSGHPPVLPRFALGNWWSRYHPYTAQEYIELMTRFSSEGIPFSVSVLDMDWHVVDVDPSYGSGWTGYSWNRTLFPDPERLLQWLHEHGLRVTLNVHPADGVRAFEDVYPEMSQALGRDPELGDPIAFDVTDQEFLIAYFEVLQRSLERDGVDFWWIDWQSGSHSRTVGIDPLWMLNHFHFLDNARDGKRPLTFSRYAGPGSHRYPVGFSGDTLVTWASLDFQPYFTATASNIGYGWWSHDVGGHMFGAKDDELATRWVQLGVFSPILRLHSGLSPFNTKEPWRFSAEAQDVMTRSLRWRHRLLPYLHTMNHRAAREGAPLVQPMYWSHPQSTDAYEVPNQFMFGSVLLVAPITAPRDPKLQLGSVLAWLPEGIWIDVFTGLVYAGGRQLVLHRDLASIPVLAGPGAIVPLSGDLVPGNAPDNPGELEVLVVVGADGAFELIEDDGTGSGLDPGTVVRTPIGFDQCEGSVTVGPSSGALGCLPERRAWRVTFLGLTPGESPTVTVDGTAVDARISDEGGRSTVSVDGVPVTGTLRVRLGPNPALTANDVSDRLFTLLDRAHIAYETKKLVHAIATTAQPLSVRLSHLQALALDRALETAVGEILLANDSDVVA
jgi:alpha-glucosidase (family GH31 glycosyl hydrolase)